MKRGRPPHFADELEAIVARSDGLAVLDNRSLEEIIGYDENGLPS